MENKQYQPSTKVVVTDGTNTQTLFKSLNPWSEETPGVWTTIGGDINKEARSSRLVPSVFAGVAARMQAMNDLPFTISKFKNNAIGDVVDDSDNYQNVLGFLPYPSRTFALTEGALTVAGRSYWYRGNGEKTKQTKNLTYWLPSSVTLDPDQLKNGKIAFKRQNKDYSVDEVLYMWLLDPDVELGPPLVWPLESAMIAAQANGAITKWVADYMKRGAVKAMLLMVDGMPPPGEVERIEGWFNRFMNGTRGLLWKVFNGTGVKPTIIGDGLEALKDLSINKELRYEIHTALGTRHLLEDENFATAEARERQFYTITVVPDARNIQYAFNEQILHKAGFHLEFEPERLEIFQENEGEQAKSFGELFSIFEKVMTTEAAFQLASEKLDYQFTDEQMTLIKRGIDEKKKEKPVEVSPPADDKQPIDPATVRALVELDKWEAKVSKAGKMCVWHAVDLQPDLVKAVRSGEITFAQARERVKPTDMLFAPAVQQSEIKELAASLNKMADAMMQKESE